MLQDTVAPKADVHKQFHTINAALHIVVKNGHVDVKKRLVQRGADINETDDDGWSPAHTDVHSGQVCVLECLLTST